MPLPWEAFIPFGLLTVMFAGAGTLLSGTRMLANDGKPPRWSTDQWDEMMMERDRRLTGSKRGQSTAEVAPEEFKTNSVWYAQQSD